MSKKKKLCYVLPFFDLEIDTHHFYLYDFIKKIADDFDLTLIIEKSNSDTKFFYNVKNIKVQKFNNGLLRVLENFYLILSARLKGNKNFYIHYSKVSALNAAIIARLSGARTFYWSCGMMWLFGRDRLLGLVLNLVSYLVTGVEALKTGYVEHYGISADKVKIMPNWIDLVRFRDLDDNIHSKYNLRKDHKYVLFVHRLAARKGVHYIADIAKDNKDTKFLIAGGGPYRKKLEEEVSNLENVILLGKVPNKDIPSLMKVSKIFFMPSEEEGFPRVLAEAMAAGLAYVAFDIGGVKEISTDKQQEYIYQIGDTEAMSKSIDKLMKDDELYQDVSRSNLEHVKQFDIHVVKNKFVELINE
jgi:glycosyltransferase involved in cell wall biosynthesis